MAFDNLRLLNTLLTSDTIDDQETIDQAFTCLRSVIMTSSQQELVKAIEDIKPPLLQKVLQKGYSNNKLEFQKKILDTFQYLLDKLPIQFVNQHFGELLNHWMDSNKSELIQVYLTMILHKANVEITLDHLLEKHEYSAQHANCLLEAILSFLGHSDLIIGTLSHKILMEFVEKNEQTLNVLFSPSYLSWWDQLKKQSDTIRMRVYSLLVSIGNLDENTFQTSFIQSNLSELTDHFRNDDPLLSLNCVYILNELAAKPYGANYLKESTYFPALCKAISDAESNPTGHLSLPSLFSSFAVIAKYHPQVLLDHQSTMTTVLSYIENDNEVLMSNAIGALTIVALPTKCKLYLDQTQNLSAHVFPRLKQCLSYQNEVRESAIVCLASLFEIDDVDDTQAAVPVLTTWYSSFASIRPAGFAQHVISLCKLPFKPVRMESFKLLRILCAHSFAQEDLSKVPDVVEYLLNRSTEFDKQTKEAKFEVIRELVLCPFTISNFGRTNFSMFKRHFNHGPLYIDTDVSVATKRAN